MAVMHLVGAKMTSLGSILKHACIKAGQDRSHWTEALGRSPGLIGDLDTPSVVQKIASVEREMASFSLIFIGLKPAGVCIVHLAHPPQRVDRLPTCEPPKAFRAVSTAAATPCARFPPSSASPPGHYGKRARDAVFAAQWTFPHGLRPTGGQPTIVNDIGVAVGPERWSAIDATRPVDSSLPCAPCSHLPRRRVLALDIGSNDRLGTSTTLCPVNIALVRLRMATLLAREASEIGPPPLPP
ncbi:hypothetical protein DFH06DRAFT_1337228 [Mycena polygramma]|nr:hypothetical protein DFH06DRAFT_1337228 [Mycena polygramma]